jgi:hypothetical protein
VGVARLGDDEAVIALFVLGFLAAADDGSAGDGAIDQQVRLSIQGGTIALDYSVQLGRQAAFAEVLEIDRDRDGRLSPEEQKEYFAALEKTLLGGLELRVDGREVALCRVGELRLEMPFRKIYRFEASCGSVGRIELHNENYPDSPGTASIVVDPPEGLDLFLNADPGTLRRDLFVELRPGTGLVEQCRVAAERLPAPSTATLVAGASLRLLGLAGILSGALLAFRRRRVAALLTWTAAAAFGIAAIGSTLPSSADAERIFRSLHETSARVADPSLRRVKALETRLSPSFTSWSPEFDVQHRWAAYGSVSHSDHAHSGVRECEGRFRVRWTGGAWQLSEQDGRGTDAPSTLSRR